MFNTITLQNCDDAKETLQILRNVFAAHYSTHFKTLVVGAKDKAVIAAKLKEIYAGPGFDEEESYLCAWQGLTVSGLSAAEYLAVNASALSVDEYEDARAYLDALQQQQRTLKAVNFIAVSTGNKITGFIMYHILAAGDETIFQLRQAALPPEMVRQFVDELMTKHAYTIFEANQANLNTLPLLTALREAQMAAAQALLKSYQRVFSPEIRHLSTKNGMAFFNPLEQDATYLGLTSEIEQPYRATVLTR